MGCDTDFEEQEVHDFFETFQPFVSRCFSAKLTCPIFLCKYECKTVRG